MVCEVPPSYAYHVQAASSSPLKVEPELRDLKRMEQAKRAGELLAQRAKSTGIEHAVFDRGGYQYHGRVRALAEGARAGGLQF